jgi:hypothetical protein
MNNLNGSFNAPLDLNIPDNPYLKASFFKILSSRRKSSKQFYIINKLAVTSAILACMINIA